FYDGTPETEYELWPEGNGKKRAVERIMPTAFDEILSRGDDVSGLFNHDRNIVLGRTSAGTMKLEKYKRGLRYTIWPANTTRARDTAEDIRVGNVRGSSFSFSN